MNGLPLLLTATAPSLTGAAVQMLLVLGGLVVVLVLASRGLRRFGAGRGEATTAGVLEIVETRRLDARRAVHLVRVGEQYFLIGSGDGRLTPLSSGELDARAIESLRDRPAPASAAAARRSFLGPSTPGDA